MKETLKSQTDGRRMDALRNDMAHPGEEITVQSVRRRVHLDVLWRGTRDDDRKDMIYEGRDWMRDLN